jgi:TonB family protein
LVWRGIVGHLRANDSLARVSFRAALRLNPGVEVARLDQVSPELADLFETEARAMRVYEITQGDTAPQRLSGPPVAYPLDLQRRHLEGKAFVTAIVDTLGHIEPQSIKVFETPDSAMIEPLRRMLLASIYAPGRVRGRPVRTFIGIGIALKAGQPPSSTQLISAARTQVAAKRPDSALALVHEALDTAAHPTEGERAYARLVEGLAWRAVGRDSLAAAAFETGLAGYRELTARGVDLAPFLRRLADSVRFARRGAVRAASALPRPNSTEPVDEQPQIVSHPPIRYSPEMQALRIGGTVLVEAKLDTTGHVLPGTVTVVQSPNPVFDVEARRVVIATVYRPARRGGRAVQIGIRQPITFAPY